jgi:hypothetical protein
LLVVLVVAVVAPVQVDSGLLLELLAVAVLLNQL